MNRRSMNSLKRDTNIELIRIIACVSVIALHTWQNSGIDEVPVALKGVIRNFEHFGVPCFLIIMGYYLFNGNKTYWHRIKDTLVRVVLPFVIAYVWYEIANAWLMGTRTLSECFSSSQLDFKTYFFDFIGGSVECNSSLWYVFEYIKIIAFTPLLSLLCKPEEAIKKIRWGYEILCVVTVAINNLFAFMGNIGVAQVSLINLSPFGVFVLYVLIGYEISTFNDEVLNKIKAKKWFFLGAFALLNLFICAEEYVNISLNGKNTTLFSENSVVFVASSVSIFIFFRAFEPIGGGLGKAIAFTGSCTYFIYLIHWTFTKLLASYGPIDFLQAVPSLIRYCIIVVLIFALSLVVAALIKLAINSTRRLVIPNNKRIIK